MPHSESTTEKAPATLITVVAKRDGFRRGGRPWPASPTTVDAEGFTPEQLADIRAEKMLVVTEGGIPQVDQTASLDRAAELEHMVNERVAEVQKNADERVAGVEAELKEKGKSLSGAQTKISDLTTQLTNEQAAHTSTGSQLKAEQEALSATQTDLSNTISDLQSANARIKELEKAANKGKKTN